MENAIILNDTIVRQTKNIECLKHVIKRVNQIENETLKSKDVKSTLEDMKAIVLTISGTGHWMSYKLDHCLKKELPYWLKEISSRLIQSLELSNTDLNNKINTVMNEKSDPKKLALEAINNDTAELIGEGPWVKDSAYRVYKVDGKFYSIIIYDSMNLYLMDDTLEEIKESEIQEYV